MTTTNTRPGRGSFAAMYEVSRQVSQDATPRSLRLDQLEANPDQPRTKFHKETLDELAASIRAYGVLQPLMVRPHPSGVPGRYQIVAGERRFQAARLAGLEAVPVVLKALDDDATRVVALIENLQRENITPLEEAQGFLHVLESTGMSHRDLGERLGKTKAYVEQRVRLLRYPIEVQAALSAGPEGASAFTPGHAKAVVQLEDGAARQRLIELVEAHGLSVREAERRVHQLLRLAGEDLAGAKKRRLADGILSPAGVAEPLFEQALQPASPPAAKTAGKPVDVRTLGIYAALQAAEAAGRWQLDSEELKRLLKADLARLS